MPDSKERIASRLRRVPKQERSRERIDDILKVAGDLIGKNGIDSVTMKEIAALSGGPIASIYQYFPNKSAIVASLYERFSTDVLGLIRKCVIGIDCPEAVYSAAERLIDSYADMIRNDPYLQDLINAIRADKGLSDMYIGRSRTYSTAFSDMTNHLVPEAFHQQYGRSVHLMVHLVADTVRLSNLTDEAEGTQMIDDFKLLMRAQLGRYYDANCST